MKASNRVILNTGVQYLRSFISIIISLYTSRIVLNNLGVNDFGIYSLVAGVIAMLAFIQSNLSSTNVRFLSYSRGKEDHKQIIEIFNNSVTTQLFIGVALCLVLLSLTGPVFNHFLNIEPERIPESKIVYYVMIGSLFFNFMSVPYLSNLISRENIVYSSIVQILDAVLKIPVALSLIWISENKLEWYAFGMMGIVVFNFLMYWMYCWKKYDECRHYSLRKFNWKLFKEMFSFMGWNVYGTVCIVGRQQGIAILLNRFFTTAINAAYGIAFQVSGQLAFISSALTNAINPQIIKAEGAGNREKMFRLSEISCKFSFLLLSIVSVPAFFYMPSILEAWLKNVPEQTCMFCRFVLLAVQIDLLTLNLNTSIQAIGRIKVYQLCLNSIKILTLPCAWLSLHLGYDATMVMIIYVGIESLCTVFRVVFLHYTVKLSVYGYLKNVLYKAIPIVALNILICLLLSNLFTGWLMLLSFFISLVSTVLAGYMMGLTQYEKDIFITITSKFSKKPILR